MGKGTESRSKRQRLMREQQRAIDERLRDSALSTLELALKPRALNSLKLAVCARQQAEQAERGEFGGRKVTGVLREGVNDMLQGGRATGGAD